jgi:hypothetical protein
VAHGSQRRARHATGAESVTVAELQAKNSPVQQPGHAPPVAASPARNATDLSARVARASLASRRLMSGFGVTASPGGAVATWGPRAAPPAPAVTEPNRVDDATEEPSTSNVLVKTIAVMVAAMVACGVVAAVGALSSARPQRLSPSTPVLRPAVMAGPMVVRPDLLDEQLTSGTGAQVQAAFQLEPKAPNPTPLAERQRAERTIIAFYHALPLRPDRAFEMLAPSMHGEGKHAFVSAWENAKDVEPRILGTRPRGEVLVAVTISRWNTSALLTVEQAIAVSDGPQPLIIWAELLSAHRG